MVAMVAPNLQKRRKKNNLGIFHRQLWAQFELTKCEEFDKALSRVEQTGSLHAY